MPYIIYTKNTQIPVSFAAQELKKYLRMMMPRCGDIKIEYNPEAKEGFILGLMSDFGIDPEVENTYLDDVIYVDADKNGGIIAGSNGRSVVQAVYRYLKKQGCIWLFPGPDGEKIPMIQEPTPVKYRHKATYRYRGQCNEGSESQPQMYNAIDFTPKVGLNTFMIEGDGGGGYYDSFYAHRYTDLQNEGPISYDTGLKWKRDCESHIEERGLMYHDYGHGWTAYPFGFEDLREYNMTEQQLSEEYKKDKYKHAAMINGKRTLFGDFHLNTNLCMSNPETRKIVADSVADYAQKQDNVDYVHVWLGDASNSHCECENCRKKTPSDWYVTMLNDIDGEMTKRGLTGKIAFIAYLDTFWPPVFERIKNQDRFILLFAPIKRFYTKSYDDDADFSAVTPYECNKLTLPRNMNESLGFLHKWQEVWNGDCFCYEYYFWRAWAFDMGSRMLAKTIWSDMKGLSRHKLSGIVEDGSQRAYFPNGFQFYVYGEMQYDNSRSFESLEKEYYSAAYGKDWELVRDYLDKIDELSDWLYLAGFKGENDKDKRHYNPSVAEKFEKIPAIVDEFMPIVKAHYDTPHRCEYVSWNLLEWHGKFLKLYSKAAVHKCRGEDKEAFETFDALCKELAPLDLIRHDCYDHFQIMNALNFIFRIRK